jgi:predicted Zn-dependent peptidase
MQGESTSARALGCVGDYFHLGRVRSLQEIEDGIKNLQVKNVIEYAQNYKPQGITLVTIGPKPLEINEQLKK